MPTENAVGDDVLHHTDLKCEWSKEAGQNKCESISSYPSLGTRMWIDYSNDRWRLLHLCNVAGVCLRYLTLCVYILLQGISHVYSRTQGGFPVLLQGSASTAFQAHVFTAESCLAISMRFTMGVSQIFFFILNERWNHWYFYMYKSWRKICVV